MIEVIENFLPKTQFKPLQEWFMNHCEWTYVPYVVGEGEDHPDDYQFSHMFWFPNRGVVSPHMDKISPLLFKINPQVWIRVKANMNPRSVDKELGVLHRDVKYDCNTAIYYVNSNNGYTEFEDGTQVKSVENRVVIFNSNMLHTGRNCTDENVRVLINLNYFT